MDKVGE